MMINTISNNQVHEITSSQCIQAYPKNFISSEPVSNNYSSRKYAVNNHILAKSKFNFAIQVAGVEDKQRSEIEQFIKQGFFKSYQAKISVTMPHLFALCNGTYKAALGIRSGKHDLFIEQYLSGTIEQQTLFEKNSIDRKDIVEIGHLFSNTPRFTLPLFMITAVSLFYLNYKYLVFSGTEKVVNLIAKSGVNCSLICDAHVSKIQMSTDEWGRYYDTKPKVIAVSLLDVIALIGQHPTYQTMFQSLDKQIAQTCQQLR
jgi:hypothetical protein